MLFSAQRGLEWNVRLPAIFICLVSFGWNMTNVNQHVNAYFLCSQEAQGCNKQQAADVSREISSQTETALQTPAHFQEQVLHHVTAPSPCCSEPSWTWRTGPQLMHFADLLLKYELIRSGWKPHWCLKSSSLGLWCGYCHGFSETCGSEL